MSPAWSVTVIRCRDDGAVATAISLLAIPSRWLPVGSTTSSVVLLAGMAVGVGYSLF